MTSVAHVRVLSLVIGLVAGLLPGTVALAEPAPAPVPEESTEWSSTPVYPVSARPSDFAPMVPAEVSGSQWPPAGVAVALARAGLARAGTLPVSVRPAVVSDALVPGGTPVSGPASVRVTLADRSTAVDAGVTGVVFSLSRADSSALSGRVGFEVDYSGFARAYGGDFGGRLRLVRLPGCALSTPAVPACRSQAPVSTSGNDSGRHVVTVDSAEVAGDTGAGPGAVYGLTSGPSSPAGTYAATSLAPSYEWSAGNQAGDFSTSYPIAVPPAPGGLVPEVTLTYSSGSVDGRTVATNNQTSWVGEGWQLEFPYIERSYRSCRLDGVSSDDFCVYDMDNLSMVFGGHSARLVKHSDGSWHAEADTALRIERLTGPWSINEVWDGEHWRITTQDGTQYWFGTTVTTTQDVLVIGDDGGEPCHVAGPVEYSYCTMAYRWNLAKVVDPHGNTMTYNYTEFRQNYGYFNNTSASPYALFAIPTSIEYGTNPTAGVTNPSARVVFANGPRCLVEPCYGPGSEGKWLDTPWDLNCPLFFSSCPGNTTPTFWSSARLTTVSTQVRNSSGGWSDVDTYALKHMFPGLPAGEESSISLWMWAIDHAGWVGGTPLSAPRLEFFGDHLPNRVNPPTGQPYLRKYRIVGIDNHVGGETEVEYNPADSCNTAVYQADNVKRCFPQGSNASWTWFHKYTIASVTEKDLTGGGPDEVWSYTYSAYGSSTDVLWRHTRNEHLGMYDQSWSVWAGYSNVHVLHGTNVGAQSDTKYRYYRGLDGDLASFQGQTRTATIFDSQSTNLPDHRAMAGRLREQTEYDGTDVISSSIHEPTITQSAFRDRSWDHGDWYALRVDETKTRTRVRLNATSTWRWSEVQISFDSYGLPVDIKNLGDTSTGLDNVCTHTDYARNTPAYLIAYPSQVVTTNCAAAPSGNDYLSGGQTLYDAATTVGAAPTRGLPTKTMALASVSGTTLTWDQATRASYDAHGRVLDAWDALDHKTTTAYTPTLGGPTTGTSVTNPATHVSTNTLDRNRGVPIQTVDANGKTTNLAYDPLGRLLKVWLPGRATNQTPNLEYTYTLRDTGANAFTTKRLSPSGSQIVSYDLYDGRFRHRQSQTSATSGRLVVDTTYDERGLTAKESSLQNTATGPSDVLVAFADVDVPRQNRHVYDNPARETANILFGAAVEQWRTTTSYDGDRVMIDPPAGDTPTTAISDAGGRTVELRQHQGSAPTGAYDATLYDYDRLGRLIAVTDPAGNDWAWTFDRRGRTTQSVDPDKGTSDMTYDDAGQQITSTDARGIVLHHTYDNLGRQTALRLTSSSGTQLASWTYDTVALGQLTSSTRYVSGAAYTTAVTGYDNGYRPLGASTTLPAAEGTLAGTWTTGMTYRVDGSPATMVYPAAGGVAAETVTYDYDSIGRPRSVAGLATYVSDTTYASLGELASQYLGTGTARGRIAYHYGSASRRPVGVETYTEQPGSPGTFTKRHDLVYSRDAAGNVVKIVEELTGNTQCFDVDYLRRLVEAHTNKVNDCSTAASAVTNRGPDPYWTTYAYDAVGNRTTETVHGVSGAADTLRTYGYPAAGATRPHAVNQVVSTGAVTGTDTYGYDNAGNTTTRNVSGTSQTLTWDNEGHLATHTVNGQTTSYIYDTSGNRLLRKNPDGSAVLYLPGWEMARAAGGQLTCTRYYGQHGRTVAVRAATGVTWLAADIHGTHNITINPATLAVTVRRSMPFGAPHGTQPSWPTDKGFVGGTTDPTGLTHLGAREYDPALGRFISVDPLIITSDPQQLNAYADASSSPTTSSDPSGLTPPKCDANGNCTPGRAPAPTPDPQPTCTSFKSCERQADDNCSAGTACRYVYSAKITPLGLDLANRNLVPCQIQPDHCLSIENQLQRSLYYLLDDIVAASAKTGIDPRLLLAVLIRESGDKHRTSWMDNSPLGLVHDFSVGIANLKEPAFAEARAFSRGEITFDLDATAEDPIKSAIAGAWLLASQLSKLPASANSNYTREELARFGYRFGSDRMISIAKHNRRVEGSEFVTEESLFRRDVATADFWICQAGYYTCTG